MTLHARPSSNASVFTLGAVCNLPSDSLSERLEMIRKEIQSDLLSQIEIPGGLAWEFAPSVEMHRKIDDLAELERGCCGAQLEFKVREEATSGRLRFEICGAPAALFRIPEDPARESGNTDPCATASASRFSIKRLSRAVGAGAMVALFVCCALPIGIAAVAGAGAAAPFASLDQPWIIAASALFFGGAVWIFEKRRAVARSTH